MLASSLPPPTGLVMSHRPDPLHYICFFFFFFLSWNGVIVHFNSFGKGWLPVSHMKQQTDSAPTLFSHYGFLLCNPKNREFNPLQTSYQVLLRSCQAFLRYVALTIRDLIREGILFCANVWNDCVVLVCVQLTHEHLGRSIFLFLKTVVHLSI